MLSFPLLDTTFLSLVSEEDLHDLVVLDFKTGLFNPVLGDMSFVMELEMDSFRRVTLKGFP